MQRFNRMLVPIWIQPFDNLIVFLKYFFEKVNFEKSQQTTNTLKNITQHAPFLSFISSRYIPPLKPATSKWSLELPDNPVAIQEELSKQESLLNQLHEELAGKADPEKEEQIWEVQRVCTQLKRKV